MQRDCRELEALLGDFAGGEIGAAEIGAEEIGARQTDELRRLKMHLSECAACREKLNELRWVDRLLVQSLRNQPVEPWLTLPGGRLAPRPGLRVGWVRPAFAAAAAGLLAFFIWGFVRDRRPDANVAQGGLERELIDRSAAAVSPPQGESANEARQWADLQASIEREASAARLAAAAEALAGQAATDAYAWESWRFVAETFPETRAGIDAARRVEARVRQPKEYRQ
jgi:hypothetical protein